MAIGAGLGGAVVISAESASTYGTWVTPATSMEVHSAKLQERIHTTQGWGIAKGRTVNLGARRALMWSDAGGTIEQEVLSTKFALLLANIMGSAATLTQVGTTTAYTLTTALGAPDAQNSLSLQSLVPAADGTITPINLHGVKIPKATFSIERGGLLTVSYDVDAQYKEQATAAVTPSWSTNNAAFNASYTGMSIKIGTLASEAALDGVKKVSFSIDRKLATDRIYVGQQYKSEPVTNGITEIKGTVDIDLVTAAQRALFVDLMSSQSPKSLLATFTGAAIGASGSNNSLLLNATSIYLDSGATPELSGPEVVNASVSFTGLIDTANDSAFTAVLTTGDSAF